MLKENLLAADFTALEDIEKLTGQIQEGTVGGDKEGLNSLVNQGVTIMLGIAVILAVFMIIFAGFQYMTSGDNASARDSAKKRIQAAFGGLLLAIASVLILNTINPGLTTFTTKFVQVKQPGLQGGEFAESVTPNIDALFENFAENVLSDFGTYGSWNESATESFLFGLPNTNRSTDGRLHFTTYSSTGDKTPDTLTTAGYGNNNNLLVNGSVALSPDLVRRYNARPGQEIFVNGVSIGFYDDTTASSYKGTSIVNTVDVYDPNNSAGDFLKAIPPGSWDIKLGEIRQQPRHPGAN